MTRTHAAEDGAPGLRADARRNHDRLVAAARTVFAEQGLRAPLGQIAQLAGVGIGTLYRRFPTREDLIAASFQNKMAEYEAAVDEALQAPTAWIGFRTYIERVCAMQADDRGFRDVLTLTLRTAPVLEETRTRVFARFSDLVERAKAEGGLRRDFVSSDLVLILMANAGVVDATAGAAPHAWRRFVGLVLEGLRADRAEPLPEPATPRQMALAMRRLSRRRMSGQREGPDRSDPGD